MDNKENNPQNNSGSQSSFDQTNNSSVNELNPRDFIVNKDNTLSAVDSSFVQSNLNLDHKSISSEDIKTTKPNNLESNNNDKSSRLGMAITIGLIIIIIAGIWQANSDNKEKILTDNDNKVNIVVDSNEETGNVTIVNGEKVENKEINLNPDTVKIVAYYNKSMSNDCEDVKPLERTIEKKYDSPVINTVRGLLTPLSEDETKAGWLSNIPAGTYLRSVTIVNGVAEVVFSSALSNVAGSCRVMAIRSQIEKTLLQFPYIKSVSICIDNNCHQDQILQP